MNPYGGAIAMGHPLASSGVRLMNQLARQFEERPEVRYGLTTMCIGIGMGGTVIWENPHFERRGRLMSCDDPPSSRRCSTARVGDLLRRGGHRGQVSATWCCRTAPARWR